MLWPLEYQIVTKTYIPFNLCDSSDSNDSGDSCDSNYSSDSCDSSDTSDSNDSSDWIFFFFFLSHFVLHSTCDETPKLK